MDAMREADLESVKKELDALKDAAKVDVSFDPATAMRDELTTAVHGEAEIGTSKIELAPPAPEALAPAIEAQPEAALEPVEREPESEPRIASQSAAE
jgi:hypothetical protein